MVDPCTTVDGFTYERDAIESWLERSTHSPQTGLPMPKVAARGVYGPSTCGSQDPTERLNQLGGGGEASAAAAGGLEFEHTAVASKANAMPIVARMGVVNKPLW